MLSKIAPDDVVPIKLDGLGMEAADSFKSIVLEERRQRMFPSGLGSWGHKAAMVTQKSLSWPRCIFFLNCLSDMPVKGRASLLFPGDMENSLIFIGRWNVKDA